MAFSFVEYTGDGTTKDYIVTFPYIDKSHVVVKVNGVVTPFIWTTPTNVQLASAPALYAYIKISRNTSQNKRLVSYSIPGNLTEVDLNTDSAQAFYLAQEAIDSTSSVVSIDQTSGQFSAVNRRLTNVADPVNDQDATTKKYVDTITGANQASLAQAAALAAAASAASIQAGKLKVTDADTTAKGLSSKLVQGQNITLSVQNAGADEQLQVSVSGLGSASTKDTGTSGASVPLLSGANTWGAPQAGARGTLTSGAAADFSTKQFWDVTVNGSTFTVANPTSPVQGVVYEIRIAFTTANAVAFGSNFKGLSTTTFTQTANAVDIVQFRYNGTDFELYSTSLNARA